MISLSLTPQYATFIYLQLLTTPEVAACLASRIHFNTFGGNPVASAVGKAVLEVIDDECLQENSRVLGNHLLEGFRALQARHPLIGDARGSGLLLGIELVRDHRTKEPARAECAAVLEALRTRGLLVGKGGLWGHVIRLAPPMCITRADADFVLKAIDEALSTI